MAARFLAGSRRHSECRRVRSGGGFIGWFWCGCIWIVVSGDLALINEPSLGGIRSDVEPELRVATNDFDLALETRGRVNREAGVVTTERVAKFLRPFSNRWRAAGE